MRMKHLKTINELHQSTIDSYLDKKLYNLISEKYPSWIDKFNLSSSMTSFKRDKLFNYSAQYNHEDVFNFLLNDPRTDITNDDNYAISLASMNGHYNIVKELLKRPEIDPTSRNNFAIISASQLKKNNSDLISLLAKSKKIQMSLDKTEEELIRKYSNHLNENNKKISQYCYIGTNTKILEDIKLNGIDLRKEELKDINIFRNKADANKQSIIMAQNNEKPVILRLEVKNDLIPVINDNNLNYKEFETSVIIIPDRLEMKIGNGWKKINNNSNEQ